MSAGCNRPKGDGRSPSSEKCGVQILIEVTDVAKSLYYTRESGEYIMERWNKDREEINGALKKLLKHDEDALRGVEKYVMDSRNPEFLWVHFYREADRNMLLHLYDSGCLALLNHGLATAHVYKLDQGRDVRLRIVNLLVAKQTSAFHAMQRLFDEVKERQSQYEQRPSPRAGALLTDAKKHAAVLEKAIGTAKSELPDRKSKEDDLLLSVAWDKVAAIEAWYTLKMAKFQKLEEAVSTIHAQLPKQGGSASAAVKSPDSEQLKIEIDDGLTHKERAMGVYVRFPEAYGDSSDVTKRVHYRDRKLIEEVLERRFGKVNLVESVVEGFKKHFDLVILFENQATALKAAKSKDAVHLADARSDQTVKIEYYLDTWQKTGADETAKLAQGNPPLLTDRVGLP
ncbi:unnamed protein product [Amoebophrya sp. A120]|nr:unnamed protein product [Amoebophrya sp. A120]|eukprot:GSA120T00005684001.1